MASHSSVESTTLLPMHVDCSMRTPPLDAGSMGSNPQNNCAHFQSSLSKYGFFCFLLLTQTSKEKHPEYGFGKHKGYGVATHMSAIHKSGPIPGVHRYTFAPLKGSAAAKKHLGSKGATVTQAPKPKPKKKQTKRKGRK